LPGTDHAEAAAFIQGHDVGRFGADQQCAQLFVARVLRGLAAAASPALPSRISKRLTTSRLLNV
jgi:hypothetical protein